MFVVWCALKTKLIVLVTAALVLNTLKAQEIRTQQGDVFKMNTTVRISGATLINSCLEGDTLSIEATVLRHQLYSGRFF